MFFMSRDEPLRPRNGHVLKVGIVARISGCQNQKEASLGDQEDHAKEIVADLWSGPVDYHIVATKGKGERLDRAELEEIEATLRSGRLDLLVVEDLGRLVRGAEAVRLLGIGADQGTRTMSPHDAVDTADPEWEKDALDACAEHVSHNGRTSKRIKQKLMNRFVKNGEVAARPIAGYIVPHGAKSYDDWVKDVEATAIIREAVHRLRESLNCSAVADWLNSQRFPTGPGCRKASWDGPMVRRFLRNPLLKGKPSRGERCTIKHHESGRRISVKNPKGPVYRDCPHLAHLEPVEFDEIDMLLTERNGTRKAKVENSVNTRPKNSRKRTRFPGQHSRCWYCGTLHAWGGNGIKDHLMCNGARHWSCWNSIGFSGALMTTKVREAMKNHLFALEGMDEQYCSLIEAAVAECGIDSDKRRRKLVMDQNAIEREKANLLAAIGEYGPRPIFHQRLEDLQKAEMLLAAECSRIGPAIPDLPRSVPELRKLFDEAFDNLSTDWEVGDLLRKLVPEVNVYLVRLCDGGHLLPRARARLSLDGILPGASRESGLRPMLTNVMTVDLFMPPKREQLREEAVKLHRQNVHQREIAKQLETSQPMIQQALKLHACMQAKGLETPYVLVQRPPEDYPKLRRHRHSRYQFAPQPNYERPAI